MVNVLKLKGKMVEKKKEVDSIVRELGLTMDETNAIFFADFVA